MGFCMRRKQIFKIIIYRMVMIVMLISDNNSCFVKGRVIL